MLKGNGMREERKLLKKIIKECEKMKGQSLRVEECGRNIEKEEPVRELSDTVKRVKRNKCRKRYKKTSLKR